jgi:biopolymer transport protein ExbB
MEAGAATATFNWATLIARGGIVLGLLAAFSVIVLAVIADRWLSLKLGGERVQFLSGLKPLLEFGDRGRALGYLEQREGPLARLVKSGLMVWGEEREFIEEAMWRQRQLEVLRWESRLSFLGTIGAVAPFVGLFGTVLGIIRAFQALAVNQAGGPGVVAEGIAEALITTAAGLFVAVPSMIGFNLFNRRIKVLRTELDAAGSQALDWFLHLSPRDGAR